MTSAKSVQKCAGLRCPLLILLVGALSGCSSTTQTRASALSASYLLIDKSDRTLTIHYADGTKSVLTGARFGSGWKLGPKRASGDEKTPEGEYHVLDHRTSGKFNYIPALYLDYPNATDRSASKALGVDPGGDILIHGPPKAMLGMHPPGNWTDGCIALSRKQMGLIMSVSKVGTRVQIVP